MLVLAAGAVKLHVKKKKKSLCNLALGKNDQINPPDWLLKTKINPFYDK